MIDWPLTDMHIHATRYRLSAPDQEMSVSRIAERLERLGYHAAGIVEHLDTNPKHPVTCLESLVSEFRSVASSVRLYVGAELDYQGGAISVPDAPRIKERLGLDYYLAAAHGMGEGVRDARSFIEDHHRRLMGIAEGCDYVDIVAHPWVEGSKFAARGLIEEWDLGMVPQAHLREFVEATRQSGKAIEISRKVLAHAEEPAFREYLVMLQESGVCVVVSSDAHSMEAIGGATPLNSLLAEAGFGPERLWTPDGRES